MGEHCSVNAHILPSKRPDSGNHGTGMQEESIAVYCSSNVTIIVGTTPSSSVNSQSQCSQFDG